MYGFIYWTDYSLSLSYFWFIFLFFFEHIYKGLSLSHKKEWNNAICSHMGDLEIIAPSEVKQTKTDIIWYHSYMEYNFLKWYRYIIYETEVDLQISKTNSRWPKEKYGVGAGEGGGWGAVNQELGKNVLTLPCIR